MMSLNLFIVLLVSTCVSSQNDYLGLNLSGCDVNDLKCFRAMFKQFFAETYKGIPAYDIKPIDPLFISSYDAPLCKAFLSYKNITIKGLKNEKLYDLKFDVDNNTVKFVIQVYPVISGNLSVKFKKDSKLYSGSYIMDGTSLVKAKCGYKLYTDSKGTKHIQVEPEATTLTCRTLGTLRVTLSLGLVNSLNHDQPFYESEIRKLFCRIIKAAYATVIQNISAADKVIPKISIVKNDV